MCRGARATSDGLRFAPAAAVEAVSVKSESSQLLRSSVDLPCSGPMDFVRRTSLVHIDMTRQIGPPLLRIVYNLASTTGPRGSRGACSGEVRLSRCRTSSDLTAPAQRLARGAIPRGRPTDELRSEDGPPFEDRRPCRMVASGLCSGRPPWSREGDEGRPRAEAHQLGQRGELLTPSRVHFCTS